MPGNAPGVPLRMKKRNNELMKTALWQLACAAVLLAGCASQQHVALPGPVERSVPPPVASDDERELVAGSQYQRPDELQRTGTPSSPYRPAATGTGQYEGVPPLRGEPISANIEGMPVPAFIDEFFGTILGVGFQMNPEVAKLNDLVTLRTPGPQSPRDFYQLAVRVLATYGVRTTFEGDRVLFTLRGRGDSFEPPLVISGRAAPEVPVSHRPVFQLVELSAVRTADVTNWLKVAFRTDGLEIQDDLNRNAVVLYGRPDVVRQAASAIRVLDRPFMRGRVSARLEPAFVPAEELTSRLVDALRAEGYAASTHGGGQAAVSSAVLIMPVPSANTVVVFAGDEEVLEHAVQWARTIDAPNQRSGEQSLFYYSVRNTKADDIVSTLRGVRTSSGIPPNRDAVSGAQTNARTGASLRADGENTGSTAAQNGQDVIPQGIAAGQIIIDEPRNAIIYQGEARDWQRLLTLIRQMDRAPRQVMIEVTIAEVSLDNDEQFGVSWLAKSGFDRFGGTVTSGVLGDGGDGFGGLTYLLDVAGEARARLRAFAEDSRVTVLSSPRLLVKSGEEASIDVGTEVPTLSSQTASSQMTDGSSNILQSIQYRKTGIILEIRPVVYSDDRIDLEIRQEVSEALPIGASTLVQSPSIFNRSMASSLSLRDGSSIMIGGLISNRTTTSDDGIPYLKNIPLLGGLFKSSSRTNSRTELVLMLVPYIVESDSQAVDLTGAMADRFEHLDFPEIRSDSTPLPADYEQPGAVDRPLE